MVAKVGRMTTIEREIINTRIRLIIKYLNRLKDFELVSLENYLNDFDQQLIAERLLQLVVEVGTDINSYLLVQLYQTTPTTYFDSLKLDKEALSHKNWQHK